MATQRAPRVEDDVGNEAAEQFFNFLNTFMGKPEDTPSTNPEPKYYENVRHMRDQEDSTLFVDFTDIQASDAHLADSISANYLRLEPFLKRAVQRLVRNVEPGYVDTGKWKEFWVSFFNLTTIRKLRDLKTEHIGQLVCFSGTVTRTSEVRPELYQGTFRCNQCGTVMQGIEQHFKYTTPLVCTNATCGNR
jgi:DNA replication licensing factor MCM6